MIPNPLLLDVTPSGGHLLNVTGEPGDLAGLTLHGVQGPAVAVEVQTDGGPWTQVTYPYTLVAGVQLRLTRTDPSAVLTTIRATFPSGGGSEAFVVTTDARGYQTIQNATATTGDRGYQTIQNATGTPNAQGFETVERS